MHIYVYNTDIYVIYIYVHIILYIYIYKHAYVVHIASHAAHSAISVRKWAMVPIQPSGILALEESYKYINNPGRSASGHVSPVGRLVNISWSVMVGLTFTFCRRLLWGTHPQTSMICARASPKPRG